MTTATHPVIGPYRVESVLGSGGFGTVYLARRRGRPVAVKVLDRADDRTLGRMRAEASAMRRVKDKHCVRVLDVIDDGAAPALVTEYVHGASLRAVLDRHGRLTGRQALDVLRGALLGLDAVHRAGMVHGDVKPANILIDRRGRARLIDFGVTRDVGSAGAGPAEITGSPSYMAPEQIRGLAPDVRSDIYACAAVLYEVLTGRRPLEADSVVSVLWMQLEMAPADPRTIDPSISDRLARLCLAGLAKDPAQRPQTARAFLAELERGAKERYGVAWRRGLGLGALAGTTSAALGRATITKSVRPRVRPWQAASGVGAAAVITAGALLLATHHAPAKPAAARPPASPAAASPAAGPPHQPIVYFAGSGWHAVAPDGTGGRSLPITGPLTGHIFAVPSPDGRRLLYEAEGALIVSKADGTGGVPIWTSPDSTPAAAAWSPDGSHIAFAASGGGSPGPPHSTIYTITPTGHDVRRVASGTNVQSLAWAPDGSRIAFTQNQADIWVVPSTGGPVHVLFGPAQGEGPDELPHTITWGSTGTLLFDEEGANPLGVWAIDATGRGARVVLPGATQPSFSTDGVHFAACRNGRIIVAATDGSPSRSIGPVGVTLVRWSG